MEPKTRRPLSQATVTLPLLEGTLELNRTTRVNASIATTKKQSPKFVPHTTTAGIDSYPCSVRDVLLVVVVWYLQQSIEHQRARALYTWHIRDNYLTPPSQDVEKGYAFSDTSKHGRLSGYLNKIQIAGLTQSQITCNVQTMLTYNWAQTFLTSDR